MNRRWPRGLGTTLAGWTPLAGYVVLAVVLSWPLLLHLDTHVLGDPAHPGLRGDLFFQYNLQQQMGAGHWPTHRHTTLLAWPEGLPIDARVTFSQFMLAYVALMSVFDLLTSRNLAGLGFLVANAMAMHLLLRHLVRRESYAWLGGFLFGFGPYIFLKVDQGFVQKTCLFAVPLFLLFLVRSLRRRGWLDPAASVACMVVTLAMYPPYGVFAAVLGAALVAAEAGASRHPVRRLRRALPVALGIGIAFVWVGLAIRDDPRPAAMVVDTQSWRQFGGYLDPLRMFRWLPYRHTFDHFPTPHIQGLPLGFPILLSVLAVLGAIRGGWRARVLLGLVGVLAVVMIGPYLPMGGRPTDLDTTLVPMPFLALGQLPLGSVLKFPIRLYPFALIALMLVAAAGLRGVEASLAARPGGGRWARWVFPAAVVLAIVETRLVFPEYERFEVAPLEAPTFYAQIHEEDFEALLLLPPEPLVSNDYVHVAVLTGKHLLNGYLEQPGAADVPQTHASDAQKRAFIQELVDLDVRYVVVYPEALGLQAPEHWDEVVWPLLGDPYGWLSTYTGLPMLFPGDGMMVYELPSG